MSDRLTVALEKFPNLANRALVMLLQDPDNAETVKNWIKENSNNDIRFERLAQNAGVDVNSCWREVGRREKAVCQ